MSSETKDAIVQAAAEIFGHFGFKKASVEDIARRASIGKGTVYLHFDSKEALFEETMRRMFLRAHADLTAKVVRAGSPEAKLRTYVREKAALTVRLGQESFPWLRKGVGTYEAMLEFAGAGLAAIAEQRKRDTALLVEILQEGWKAGVFHVTEPEVLAEGVVEIIDSSSTRLITNEPGVVKAVNTVLEMLVRGVLNPRAQP